MGHQWEVCRCPIRIHMLRSQSRVGVKGQLIQTFIRQTSPTHLKVLISEFLSSILLNRICGKDLHLASVILKIWTTLGLWMPPNRKLKLGSLVYIQAKLSRISTSKQPVLTLALRKQRVAVTKDLSIDQVWMLGWKRFLTQGIKII